MLNIYIFYLWAYRAVSRGEGEGGGRGWMGVKVSNQPPPAPAAGAVGPCPAVVRVVGRPGAGGLPGTIAPPGLPLFCSVILSW